jgi:hypothetical protein
MLKNHLPGALRKGVARYAPTAPGTFPPETDKKTWQFNTDRLSLLLKNRKVNNLSFG